MNAVETHPLAHIAPGPYVFVGLETEEHRNLYAAEARANMRAYTTNTTCGGSCDLCGMAIVNVYRFRGSNGKVFKLGCDCAQLGFANSPAMLAEVKEAKRALARERRAALREQRRQERIEAAAEQRRLSELERSAEREKRVAALRERNPEWYQWVAGLQGADGFAGEIAKDFGGAINEGHPLSIKQAKLLHSLYMQRTAPDVGHFGDEGQRCKGIAVSCEGASVSEGIHGPRYMYKFRTNLGHALVCFHNGRPLGLDINDKAVISFTVKRHSMFDGKSNTQINRVKVTEHEQRDERYD